MRIAVYHNLPPGGAVRFLREVIDRSADSHEYHLFRVVDGLTESIPDSISDRIAGVTDVHPRVHLNTLVRLWPASLQAARLAALWDAETLVADGINAGGFDLCFVNSCVLTHSPMLLTRLRIPSLYFAQEPRRVSVEAELRRQVFARSRGVPAKAILYASDALLQRTDRRAVAAATAVACNSLFSAEAMYRVYGRNAEVVRLGVDTELFRPSGASRDDYVLSVGAADPNKGHATVIAALGLLPKTRRPAFTVAYGRSTADTENELRSLADRGGVELRLRPTVSDAELVALYSAARATICAARLEPFGLTPLESLSCGTPVIAINEGGYRESVTDGENGVLVEPTPAGIAAGIAATLHGRITSDTEELRSTVRTWTWDRTVRAIHQLYPGVLSAWRQRASA